jgi:glycosyltransferase involved in cell wall biosynthesis
LVKLQKSDNITSPEIVSIILPTYNRADMIEDCIHSILSQTYFNFELIVVDDSSTDETEKIVRQLATKDQRIQYYKNDVRKGLPASRNIGISKSKGDYIFFIEDDAEVDQHCVEFLIRDFASLKTKKIRVGGITPSVVTLYEDRKPRSILDYACRESNARINVPCKVNKLTGLRHFNFSPEFKDLQEVPDIHARSLYPRSVLEQVGGYDEKRYQGNFLYEETDLNYRIRKKGYKFYFEPKAILYHKITSKGGCRVNTLRYGYFFILNHIKFVTKNYNLLQSLYMIPSFLFFVAFIVTKSLLSYIFQEKVKYP